MKYRYDDAVPKQRYYVNGVAKRNKILGTNTPYKT